MSSRYWWVAAAMLVLSLCAPSLLASRAAAQDPDIQMLTPVVMLVLDTSGSMEGMADCSCPGNPDSNLCPECYPVCGRVGPADDKNRWTQAIEALSGSFEAPYRCQALDRNTPVFTYDRGYIAPHHALPPPVTPCTLLGNECTTGVFASLGLNLGLCLPLLNLCGNGIAQNDDGVLDTYLNDVRFGLMTFDTIGTYTGSSQLVADYEFSNVRSESVDGMFSFGGPRDFTYPNCISTYRTDSGVRSEVASEGRMISAGSDSANWQAINGQIQDALHQIRPYGGTPIAASLSDLDYYFRNHPDMVSDSSAACRGRYGVLITDGKPDTDFRQFGCDQPGFQCPYDLPEDEAGKLRCGLTDPSCSGGGTGSVKQLFVIGLDVTDPDARMQLNAIAQRGGNAPDVSGDYALFASDAATITSALAGILDATQTRPISRTTPLVVHSKNSQTYRITTAFERPGRGLPWNGLIERAPLGCDTENNPALTDTDRFHVQLNNQGPRKLFSALPNAGHSPNATMNQLTSGSPCTLGSGCLLSNFGSASCDVCGGTEVTHTETNSVDAAAFTSLANWVHADTGSGRETTRLGAVYHSSPVFASAPRFDLADSSFSLAADEISGGTTLRDRTEVVYTGTNDGILHAFRLEGDGARPAGEELWGFIPPMLLDKLEAARNSPQIMLDGTPVVKNMVLDRDVGAAGTASDFQTVLVAGMRQGGNGYFALNVTDPENPEFLWQFTNNSMGFSYGRPALAQVRANFQAVGVPGAQPDVTERAIAILPGGTGNLLGGACNGARNSGGAPFDTAGDSDPSAPAVGPTHRSRVRCWDPNVGRGLHFIDVKTGYELNSHPSFPAGEFNQARFPSPLVGSPAVFNGNEGALSTRAFVVDADGVMWRVDFSSETISEWGATAFHDMAWGLGFDEGQAGYEPPVISVDTQDRVVVMYGQGDIDNFENPIARNRVVSLTELHINPATTRPEDYKAGFNWEYNLPVGALVTGPLVLFQGALLFATFEVIPTNGAICEVGSSKLWALDYTAADPIVQNSGPPVTPYPVKLDYGPQFNITEGTDDPTLYGKLVMGLSVAQKSACAGTTVGTSVLPTGWGGPETAPPGTPPVYEVVGTTTSGLDGSAGAQIGQITRSLQFFPRTRVVGWAGAAD